MTFYYSFENRAEVADFYARNPKFGKTIAATEYLNGTTGYKKIWIRSDGSHTPYRGLDGDPAVVSQYTIVPWVPSLPTLQGFYS